MKDPGQRAKRLAGTVHAARPGRISFAALEDYHKQIRNLGEYACYKHRTDIMRTICSEIIPDLVRLDMAFTKFEPQHSASSS